MTHLLAAWQPDDIFALIFGMLIFMIPIIAILTQHQQKMARLFREGQAQNPQENEALRREVETLRQLVMQQTIAIDNLSARHFPTSTQVPPTPPLESRLNE